LLVGERLDDLPDPVTDFLAGPVALDQPGPH
jgi:hypothetical protein